MSRKLTLILPALGAMALLAGFAVTSIEAQTPPPAAPAPANPPAPPARDGHPHMSPAERFAARDTNHDGFIDKTEANAALLQRFDEIDTNHDGKISPDEMKAAWKNHMGHGFKHGAMGAGGMHPMMGGGAHLAMLDTNHDGKISWEEMSAAAKARFDALDTNHDGFIDASEMPKGPRVGHMHHKRAPGDTPLPPPADKPAQ